MDGPVDSVWEQWVPTRHGPPRMRIRTLVFSHATDLSMRYVRERWGSATMHDLQTPEELSIKSEEPDPEIGLFWPLSEPIRI